MNTRLGRPKQLLLTKGDDNVVDDLELYDELEWLGREHIVGKVWGSVLFLDTAFWSSTDAQIYPLHWLRVHIGGTPTLAPTTSNVLSRLPIGVYSMISHS